MHRTWHWFFNHKELLLLLLLRLVSSLLLPQATALPRPHCASKPVPFPVCLHFVTGNVAQFSNGVAFFRLTLFKPTTGQYSLIVSTLGMVLPVDHEITVTVIEGVPQNTTVHPAAPHHPTPPHPTPHRTTPHNTSPHRTAPHHTTPHNTSPHRTTLHRTGPHHTTMTVLEQRSEHRSVRTVSAVERWPGHSRCSPTNGGQPGSASTHG